MENVNPFVLVPPNGLRVRITRETNELRAISTMIDSRHKNIDHTLSNVIDMDDLESEDEFIDTPLVSPFLDSDDESDDGEALNELDEYGNAGNFYPNRIINSLDGEDLAFLCIIGFRNFVAYFYPFLPMNIITRKAYVTIMVEGLESTGMNLVAVVRDVYVFVGSFTYVTDFAVLEDIGELLIFDAYIFRIPRTIPRLKKFEWSKVMPILVLIQRDLMSGLRIVLTERGDGVAGFKRRRQEFYGDGVMDLTTASRRSQLKAALGLTHIEKPICLRTSKSQVYGYLIRFLALGWHLEEIHVTWAHLEKKRTRLRLYTIYLEEFYIRYVETALQVSSDGVRIFMMTTSLI
ncbi:hypothetical protein Tco_0875251 [Tanacetum coccineum]|uniref:Uncharacterized protein n=1 Tax=Tanacetum coccineum TaxID=301880 RepID=A0ABQ5BNY9_9ASTR